MTMPIRIFITGGTFDKEYNELDGKLFFKDTHLPEMLKLGRCKVPVEIRTLMLVDSLEMTDADRQIIVEQCQKCKEDRIVITHGTDTMEETARVLVKTSMIKPSFSLARWFHISLVVRMDYLILAARSHLPRRFHTVSILR